MGATVASPRFVGRAEELRRLAAGLAAIEAGRAATVLVGGDAGVGKTRLIEEFLARVQAAGAIGLLGGCLDVEEGRLPFGPFIEALRPRVRALGPAARAELTAPGGEELAVLLPELGGAPDPAAPRMLAQGRLFELVLGLLGRLAAEAPLVLVFEDVHWSERSTRDLLAFLARNLRGERVLLVATYRSDELYRGHPLRPLLAELERNRRVERLELNPFSRHECSEQLTGILGGRPEHRLLESVFERSQGNAFLAEELVAGGAVPAGLPPTLRDILLMRADGLSPRAQQLLRVVAVGGRLVSDRLLAAISTLSEADRLAALHEAVSHHLLESRGSGGYGFRHELVREALYGELLPEERSGLHAAYGRTLSAHPELAGDPETVTGDLARHWFAAHDLPRALAAAVDAGAAAQQRSGFAEAQAHYERALELWEQVDDAERAAAMDKVELIRFAAEAANLAGDGARAAALTREALAQLGSAVDPARAGVMCGRLGRFLWSSGDTEAGFEAYEHAVRLVPAQPPSSARARVLAARGQGLMLLARYEESRACCEEAIMIARQVGARAVEGHALNTLGYGLAYLGEPEAAVENLRAALLIAEQVGDVDDLCRAYLNLSDCLAGPLNRLDEALALALEGIELSQRRGTAMDYGVSLQSAAVAALTGLGRYPEAMAIVSAAETRDPTEIAAIDLRLERARLELCQGALEDAAATLADARRLMVHTTSPPYQGPLRALDAELALWRGDPGEAIGAVAAGLEHVEAEFFAAPLLWLGLWAAADAVTGIAAPGRSGESGALLLAHARELADADEFVSPAARAYADLCEAEATRRERSRDPEPWRRAAASWEALGRPYLESYARWREAETLLAGRHLRDGTAALRRAHAIASGIGAGVLAREIALLAGRARIEIAPASGPETAAGAPTAPTATEAAAAELGLTARQCEVLSLIAAGRTNREIAETLFITEKTAGAHVSGILGRLGVRSRVEAATTAHRLGLVPAGDSP